VTKLSLVSALCSLLCAPVFAAEGEQWEISGSTRAPLQITSRGSNTVTTFDFEAGVGYFVTPMFELSFAPSVAIVSGTATTSIITLAVGPSINFGGASPRDDFSLGAAIGVVLTDSGGLSSTNFAYVFSLGKRFPITSSISYAPSIGFVGITSTPSTTSFVISPLAFSLFL
jgi:hypothetical protein